MDFLKKALLFLLFIGSFALFSQTYQPSQLINMGGAWNDFVKHSVVDQNGFIYATGSFTGISNFGKDSLLSAGNSDVFLVKIDPNGGVEWAKRAGGQGADEGKRVVVTQSSVYVLGNFRDFANFSNPYNYGENQIPSLGGNDFFIAKYHTDGTFLWAKRGGGISDDLGYGFSVSGNQIIVTGGYQHFADFNTPPLLGNKEIESNGGYDCFVAFYDTLGNFKEALSLGGTTDDFGTAVLSDQTHFYLAGTFSDSIIFNEHSAFEFEITSNYSVNVFLTKFSNSNHCIWAQTIGSAGIETVTDLAILGESVLVTGTFQQTALLTSSLSQNNKQITSKGGVDFYLAKYQNNGVLDWVVSGGGANEDLTNSIFVTPTEILLCGHFSNTISFDDVLNDELNSLTSSGFSDIFIASYGYDGAFKWGRKDGGTSIDFGTSVLKYKNDLFCLGNFNLFSRFGEDDGTFLDIVSNGGIDFFITKYSLDGNGIGEIQFNIFPNPCFTHLNIVLDPGFMGEEYGIYDLVGKCMSRGKIHSNSFFVDVTSYSSGVYIFKTSKKRMQGVQFVKL